MKLRFPIHLTRPQRKISGPAMSGRIEMANLYLETFQRTNNILSTFLDILL